MKQREWESVGCDQEVEAIKSKIAGSYLSRKFIKVQERESLEEMNAQSTPLHIC